MLLGLAVGCAAPAPWTAVPTWTEAGRMATPQAPGTTAAPARVLPKPPPPDRWLAEDKLQHFALSFAATAMTYGGARLAVDAETARPAAAGVAMTLGIGKELVDLRAGARFSLKDLMWDAAGVALGYTFIQRVR